MRKSVFLFLLLVIPGTAQAQISGVAEAVAGDVLRVKGVTVHLHGIVAPKPDLIPTALMINLRAPIFATRWT